MNNLNERQAADVAIDHMAGTLADTYARAPGPCLLCMGTGGEKPGTECPICRAQSCAKTSTVKPEALASGRSGVAPEPGVIASTILMLPYPISANRYWASRTVKPKGKPSFTSTYVTKEAQDYKAQVRRLAQVAGVRKPIAGRVKVEFILYPNRPQDWQKRMRKDGAAWDDTVQCLDLDNAQKVVLDSLKDVVFQDDAWVREIHARRAEPDEFGARLTVVVTPLAVAQPQTDLFAQERGA